MLFARERNKGGATRLDRDRPELGASRPQRANATHPSLCSPIILRRSSYRRSCSNTTSSPSNALPRVSTIPRYLLRLAELELFERERRMVERRIKEARFLPWPLSAASRARGSPLFRGCPLRIFVAAPWPSGYPR